MINFFCLLALLSISRSAFSAEGKEGHGAHPFEVMFEAARKELIEKMNTVNIQNIHSFKISSEYIDWFLDDIDGTKRLNRFKYYLKNFKFHFTEKQGCAQKRPICFSLDEMTGPVVIVSFEEATELRIEGLMAGALIVHEVGHFTKEMDHGFLSSLGLEVMKAEKLKEKSKELIIHLLGANSPPCEQARENAAKKVLDECRNDPAFKLCRHEDLKTYVLQSGEFNPCLGQEDNCKQSVQYNFYKKGYRHFCTVKALLTIY